MTRVVPSPGEGHVPVNQACGFMEGVSRSLAFVELHGAKELTIRGNKANAKLLLVKPVGNFKYSKLD